MSELQTALLAIGFGVIVAVYVFGWWQQRKHQRKFGTAFKASHADALYQENSAGPAEPEPALAVMAEEAVGDAIPVRDTPPIQLSGGTPSHSTSPAKDAGQVAGYPASGRKGERENEAEGRSFEERPMQFSTLEEAAPAAEMPANPVLDGSCALLEVRSDFIIELHLAEPSPAAVLDGLWQRKFDFGKPVQVCGLTLPGKMPRQMTGQQWERAIAESQTLYERFRIALQLVDRGGAISAARLADFRDLVLGIAKLIKADTAVPDVDETHRRAAELDAFCAEVDQMVGINLVPPGERLLPGARIAQAAALHGMTLEADGAFHALNAQGHSAFSLINQDSKPFQHHTLETFGTPGLTLLLDVPRVENPAVQFDEMLRIAHELARELQVNLVDDHRVVLSDNGLARIRAQIAEVEAKMRDNGIAPGSGQARRLFA
ncbi:MAG: cell division protein ZipA C-terminal FtsZ-binding domain-containing protein [Nitrosomonadales bacterium]|nr:cell division protein ZipA C-terminal FtsZ-binding domain-containing protein [Nitrosomonadales bacterium]